MTLALDVEEGFRELLAVAGVELAWGGVGFPALLSAVEPKAEPYDLTPGDDNAVAVRVLLKAFPDGLPVVGDSFSGPAGEACRVRRVKRSPNGITITFECEVTHP